VKELNELLVILQVSRLHLRITAERELIPKYPIHRLKRKRMKNVRSVYLPLKRRSKLAL